VVRPHAQTRQIRRGDPSDLPLYLDGLGGLYRWWHGNGEGHPRRCPLAHCLERLVATGLTIGIEHTCGASNQSHLCRRKLSSLDTPNICIVAASSFCMIFVKIASRKSIEITRIGNTITIYLRGADCTRRSAL
jgi:hypothetical protein